MGRLCHIPTLHHDVRFPPGGNMLGNQWSLTMPKKNYHDDSLSSNGDPMPAVTWRKAGVPVNPDGLDTDAAR